MPWGFYPWGFRPAFVRLTSFRCTVTKILYDTEHQKLPMLTQMTDTNINTDTFCDIYF